jgi:invasion protein IalB
MMPSRLPRHGAHRICPAMRAIFSAIALLVLFAAPAAEAQTHKPPAKPAPVAGPKALGKYDDWTAAIHQEAGQTVCYAFVRVQSSVPALPGRGDVVLTVTERPAGRDAVAIFYTSQRNAFARDGGATVAALLKGRQALARSPGPRGAQVTDTFSLRGFGQAYAAIVKACPPAR